MFHVRTIIPEERRAETSTFPTSPTHPLTRRACELFDEFFHNRPAQFQDKLRFMPEDGMELEWLSVDGGSAFAALYEDGNPVTVSLLLSGTDEQAERGVIEGSGKAVFGPILGDDTDDLMRGPGRPLMVTLMVPGHGELRPTLDLLNNALASFYFRSVAHENRDLTQPRVEPIRPPTYPVGDSPMPSWESIVLLP